MQAERSLQLFTEKGGLAMGSFGKAQANDTGEWTNNKEMNPAANSSVTEDGLLEDRNTRTAGGDWRGEEDEATGDPGRTPGKAEGVENPERQGNQ
jgi:hypothetical protein